MPEPAIVATDLTKAFGSFTAVDHVSLQVEPGEIFGFLGSNGCGKTTTIRMLCGLLQPTSGQATVAGRDVGREPEEVRKRIGYVAQFFNLYGDLSVEENLRFFGGVYGVERQKLTQAIDYWTERLSLSSERRSRARTLSMGQQRSLGLAAAVLHEPAILMLDEPTSGVDPRARREFFAIIGELANQGTSILVTTHVMDEAERCARLALMNRGRIIAEGTPAEIKGRGQTTMFRVAAQPVSKAVDLAPQHPAVANAAVFGDELQFGLAEADAVQAGAVVAWLKEQGLTCGEPRPVRIAIEHAFLELLRRDEAQHAGEAA